MADFEIPSSSAELVEVPVAPDADTERFLAERKSGIGGTDAAALVGLHPYRTLSDVVLEKRGLIPQSEQNERMYWGTALEEPVARAYAQRLNVRLRRVNLVLRDEGKPHRMGHPDRLVIGQRKGVEIKTVGAYAASRWSAPGEPVKIPEEYYCQVQWYLGLTGFDAWDLAALFGVQAMRVYPVVRNDRVIDALRARADEVWERYVVGEELPPMDASPRTLAFLKERYPKEEPGQVVVANQEQEEWVRAWRDAASAETKAKEQKDQYRAHIIGAIGRAESMVGDGWQATFKANRDTVEAFTDWEAVTMEIIREHNLSLPAELVMKHSRTTIKPGSRVLRYKEVK